MPMPKRSNVDDFVAQLEDVQRPHLEELRALSGEVDPEAREVLKWNRISPQSGSLRILCSHRSNE